MDNHQGVMKMIYVACENTQEYTGKRGNKFVEYEIITDSVIQEKRSNDYVLIAYLDDPAFYLREKKNGVPTRHLFQQTPRAIAAQFDCDESEIEYVSSEIARKILSTSFVLDYA
jgi:uncharacterized membrane-anchored protein